MSARIVRATLYPNNEVISVGVNFQPLLEFCGHFEEVSANIKAFADDYTLFEIAATLRGPMYQVDSEDWKPA